MSLRVSHSLGATLHACFMDELTHRESHSCWAVIGAPINPQRHRTRGGHAAELDLRLTHLCSQRSCFRFTRVDEVFDSAHVGIPSYSLGWFLARTPCLFVSANGDGGFTLGGAAEASIRVMIPNHCSSSTDYRHLPLGVASLPHRAIRCDNRSRDEAMRVVPALPGF